MSGGTRIVGAQRSVAGPREGNEDATLFQRLAGGRIVAAVADGMGGLGRGDVASRLAVHVLEREVASGSPLAEAVHRVHGALLREAREEVLGSTLVAALVEGEVVWVVNVGDSRAFHRGADGMSRITRDHTVAAEAAEAGMEDHAVQQGRWAESLTRSLGTEEELEVDGFGPILLRAGDHLLLCSDGLHRVLPDDAMERLLVEHLDPAAAASALVEEALRRGSADNVSAVILHRTTLDASAARPGTVAPRDEGQAGDGVRARRAGEPSDAGRQGAARPGWDPGDMMTRSRHQRRRAERRGLPPGTIRVLLVVAAVALVVVALLLLSDRLS